MILVNLQLKLNLRSVKSLSNGFILSCRIPWHMRAAPELNACALEGDPDAVEVISKWETKSHYEKYLAWREEDGTLGKLGAYLAADPVFRFLEADLQI